MENFLSINMTHAGRFPSLFLRVVDICLHDVTHNGTWSMCVSLTVGGECDVCLSLCVCVVGSGGAQGEGKPCGQVAGGAEQSEGAPGRGQPSLCQAEGEALSLTFVHH